MYKIGIKPLIYRIIVRIKENKKIVSSEAYGIFFFKGKIEQKLRTGFEVMSSLTWRSWIFIFIMGFSEVHKKEQYSECPYTHQLTSTISSKMLLLFHQSLIHSYYLSLFLLEYLQQILDIMCFCP